jgi:hypothetical protein
MEREYDLLHAPAFNIFRILKLSRREVRAHTPMLGDLLDPQGIHSQGSLFLDAFLSIAAKQNLKLPGGSAPGASWKVRTEEYCGEYGIIDIIVRCKRLGYLLVIENKIDAQEGNNQLKRYHNWMETQRRSFPHRQLAFLGPLSPLQ